MEKAKQELEDLENEEEVKERINEFKQHALYKRLSEYSEELKDFILEK